MDITKRAVKEALGFTQDTQLARFFDTTKQAVSKWADDDALPDGRQWQARALRPDLFPVPAAAPQDDSQTPDAEQGGPAVASIPGPTPEIAAAGEAA